MRIHSIRLPLRFNAAAMLAEVLALPTTWRPHDNQGDYTGEWQALALRSLGGSLTNLMGEGAPGVRFLDTALLAACPTIAHAVNELQCEKRSIRVLNLKPGAVIKEHHDPGLSYEDGLARIHIPLQTHSGVRFTVARRLVPMQTGECWYVNFSAPHGVVNEGAVDRIHLVLDCVVNDWIHHLFQNAPEREAMDESELARAKPAAPHPAPADGPVDQALLTRITAFLDEIGIPCRAGTISRATVLPGLDIQDGVLLFDLSRRPHLGDLLHEAGHLAVLKPDVRATATAPDNLVGDLDVGAAEMGAIAWSWAAVVHLGLDPEVVFHAHGYRGNARQLVADFKAGRYLAVPLLQWMGMTTDPHGRGPRGTQVYPAMKHWLRPASPT
ncbi:MAG: aspartyl/asparaginyl beta-hydroxylase domain-containing protein [Myxococcota bacterium]